MDLDDSSDSIASFHVNLTQLSSLLITKGFLKRPLTLDSLPESQLETLVDLLYELLSQRDHDVDFRETLIGENRRLQSEVERLKRFLREEKEATSREEKEKMKERARVQTLSSTLASEQCSHKSTKEELSKAKRELSFLKTSSIQSKLSSERQSERIRSRLIELTNGNLRGLTPEVRILQGHFPSTASVSVSSSAHSVEMEQIKELEKKRSDLLNQNQALKRISTDSINGLKGLGGKLNAILRLRQESELGTSKNENHPRSGLRSSATTNKLDSSTSTSSANSISDGTAIPQRDLFPPTNPLSTTSASSVPSSHPAIKTLSNLLDSIRSNLTNLEELEESKRSKKLQEEQKERELQEEEEFKRGLREEERERRTHLEEGRIWGTKEMQRVVSGTKSKGKGKAKEQEKEKEDAQDQDQANEEKNHLNSCDSNEAKKLESLRNRYREISQDLADKQVLLQEKEEEIEQLKRVNMEAGEIQREREQVERAKEELEKEREELEREKSQLQHEKQRLEEEKQEVEKGRHHDDERATIGGNSKGKRKMVEIEDQVQMGENPEVEMGIEEDLEPPSKLNQVTTSTNTLEKESGPSGTQHEDLDAISQPRTLQSVKRPRKSRLHSRLVTNIPRAGGEEAAEIEMEHDSEPIARDSQKTGRRSARLSKDSDPSKEPSDPNNNINNIASSASHHQRIGTEEKLTKIRRERREAMEKNPVFSSSTDTGEKNGFGSDRNRGIKRSSEMTSQQLDSDPVGSGAATKKQRTNSSNPDVEKLSSTSKPSSSSSSSSSSTPNLPANLRAKSKMRSTSSSLKNATNHPIPADSERPSPSDAETDPAQKPLLGPRAMAKARSEALLKEKTLLAQGLGGTASRVEKTPSVRKQSSIVSKARGLEAKAGSKLVNSRKP